MSDINKHLAEIVNNINTGSTSAWRREEPLYIRRVMQKMIQAMVEKTKGLCGLKTPPKSSR